MVYLTPNQRKVVDFVGNFRARSGHSPTLDEIAARLRVTKATAQGYVRGLCEKNVLRKTRYEHRSIEVIEGALGEDPSAGMLLLAGRIAAGEPIEAIENDEYVNVGEVLGLDDRRERYLLEVKGDSMIEDGIFDGDYVIIEKRATAQNGDTVVAILGDGSATLKRFYREKSRIRLQPANRRLKPIYTRDVEIRGVVRGVVRSL